MAVCPVKSGPDELVAENVYSALDVQGERGVLTYSTEYSHRPLLHLTPILDITVRTENSPDLPPALSML